MRKTIKPNMSEILKKYHTTKHELKTKLIVSIKLGNYLTCDTCIFFRKDHNCIPDEEKIIIKSSDPIINGHCVFKMLTKEMLEHVKN